MAIHFPGASLSLLFVPPEIHLTSLECGVPRSNPPTGITGYPISRQNRAPQPTRLGIPQKGCMKDGDKPSHPTVGHDKARPGESIPGIDKIQTPRCCDICYQRKDYRNGQQGVNVKEWKRNGRLLPSQPPCTAGHRHTHTHSRAVSTKEEDDYEP